MKRTTAEWTVAPLRSASASLACVQQCRISVPNNIATWVPFLLRRLKEQANKQKKKKKTGHHIMNFSDEGGKLLKPGIRCEESLAPQDADDTNKPRTPLAAVTEKVWRHWKPTKQIRNLKPASEVTYAGFPVGARGKWSWANQALRAALSHGKQTSLGCQVLVGKSHSSVNILNSFMGQTGGQSSAVAKDGPMGISHSMMSAGDLAWVGQDTQKRLCMADIAGVIEEGSTVSLTAWSCQWIPAFL